jgi:hypothetical protein
LVIVIDLVGLSDDVLNGQIAQAALQTFGDERLQMSEPFCAVL